MWYNKANTNDNLRNLLIFDFFCDHLINSIKNRLNEKQTDIAIISKGLTSKL